MRALEGGVWVDLEPRVKLHPEIKFSADAMRRGIPRGDSAETGLAVTALDVSCHSTRDASDMVLRTDLGDFFWVPNAGFQLDMPSSS